MVMKGAQHTRHDMWGGFGRGIESAAMAAGERREGGELISRRFAQKM